MFILSAFADEISPDPQVQLDILKTCGVRHIEFRSIHKTNVLNLSDEQIAEFKALLDREGFKLSAIGSPIGKIRIDEPFEPHLEKFKRAIHLCRVFGTPNIRVFSYYPPENFDGNWGPYRNQVMDRMRKHVEIAEREEIQLFHENEHRIYGDNPERLADLYTTIPSRAFQAAFDPANFIFCGYNVMKGWAACKAHTGHFHIKDWKTGEEHGSIAGEGFGQIPAIIADAVQMGYQGFATLEPHLLGGGPTGGVTGPELFPKAVAAFKAIVEKAGGQYQ
ncbi:MAG: sugar phosphate isomerase/epimerase [Gemmataceae bacterium]|nr:sugar phosphate isomerase/epimerase [Gemmataceae bacterium]